MENHTDLFDSKITGDDLKKVLAWSSTQVMKIDKYLKLRLPSIWPSNKKSNDEFYECLLSVVDDGHGVQIENIFDQLGKQQPKNKKGIYFIWPRFYLQMMSHIKKLDFEKYEEFWALESEPSDKVDGLIEFLNENGHQEYKIVNEHFILNLFESESETETNDNDLLWSNKQTEVTEILKVIQKHLINSSIGLYDNVEEISSLTEELIAKGNELKTEVLQAAEEVGLSNQELWSNSDDFTQFCNEVLDKYSELPTDYEVWHDFYGKLVEVLKHHQIKHRSPKFEKQLVKILANAVSEIKAHRELESLTMLSGPSGPQEWLVWAFDLEGEELDELQTTLEEVSPALSTVVGQCEYEWLVPISDVDAPKEGTEAAEEIHFESQANAEIDEVDSKDDADSLKDSTESITDDSDPIFISEGIVKHSNLTNELSQEDDEVPNALETIDTEDEPSPKTNDSCQKIIVEEFITESTEESTLAEEGKEDEVDIETPPPLAKKVELLKTVINRDQYAKAYWLTVAEDDLFPPSLMGAFALGHQIGVGAFIPSEMHSFLGNLINEDFDEVHEKLLLLGAITNAALFSEPSTGEVSILIDFIEETGFSAIDEMVNLIKTDYLYRGQIRREDLNQVLTSEERKDKISNLSERSREHLKRVNNTNIRYEPANVYLRQLYQEGSDLSKVHRAINRNLDSQYSEILSIIQDSSGDKFVSEASKLNLKINRPIKGFAKNQLVRKINETLSLGREWCALVSKSKGHSHQTRNAIQINQLKKQINRVTENVAAVQEHSLIGIAKQALSFSYNRLLSILDGEQSPSPESLNLELFSMLSIALDDDLQFLGESKQEIINNLKNDEVVQLSPDNIRELVGRKEYLRAHILIERYGDRDGLANFLEDKIEQTAHKITVRIDSLKVRVEDAYWFGRLAELYVEANHDDADYSESKSQNNEENTPRTDESVRSELIGTLDNNLLQVNDENFGIAWRHREITSDLNEIEKILEFVEASRKSQIQEEFQDLHKQFDNSELSDEDGAYIETAFKEAIQAGDGIAALELINRTRESLSTNTPIPRAKMGENLGLEQFVIQLEVYQELLRRKDKIRSYISTISSRKKLPGINIEFAALDKAHLEKSTSGLTAWNQLLILNHSRSGELIVENFEKVIDFLDLKTKRKSLHAKTAISEDFTWFSIELEYPINSCPVPDFGSSMGTIVNIILCKNKKDVNQFYSFLCQQDLQTKPVFLIYLQEMGIRQRLKYQRFFCQKKLSVLVIDICLAFHLSGIRDRLPALFETTLPFCYVQPYLMKGANVPNEIFVGRDEEVKSILDPDGSCIIYGGRQLGKSALLRHLYNEYDNPDIGTYITYIEIDALGMEPQPHDQMVETFWREVHRNLCRVGFIEEKKLRSRKALSIENEVVDEIKVALEEDEAKRLYLLLDESDNFIDKDSQYQFPVIRKLRSLVVSTNRKFKIILAGLQSVQRYKNLKNHPFAQLGSDIVIKPLDPNSAQQLILVPLSSLGFWFESTELILRILSQANYHPGLIQIFCYRLLEKLYKKSSTITADSTNVMREITLEDLQTIERDPNFNEEIKERFDWTLDLDDRYKVLIYALILETENFSVARNELEFMDIARRWWPQVFTKLDQQALRSILDELVGLGVLVREDHDFVRAYRLRSPNLLRLLGPKRQIEEELTRLISLDKPRTLNSMHFHPVISKKPLRFGPLTSAQEGQISNTSTNFSISVIVGSVASGLYFVKEQLKKVLEDEIFDEDWHEIKLPNNIYTSSESLVRYLKDKLRPRKRTNQYFVVDLTFFPTDLYNSVLFRDILNQCKKGLCTKTTKGHVFFLMDHNRLWMWLKNPDRQMLLTDKSFNEIVIKRWSDGAITNALDNIDGITGGKAQGERIFAMTSGWHSLIHSGLDKISTRDIKKLNTPQFWENLIKDVNDQIVTDNNEIRREFGLVSDHEDLAEILEGVLEWCKHDNQYHITKDAFEIWQEEEGTFSDWVIKEQLFRSWLQTLDLAYINPQGLLALDQHVSKIVQCFELA